MPTNREKSPPAYLAGSPHQRQTLLRFRAQHHDVDTLSLNFASVGPNSVFPRVNDTVA